MSCELSNNNFISMEQHKLEGYRKPLLELIETESAEVIAASPKVNPSTTPFEEEDW